GGGSLWRGAPEVVKLHPDARATLVFLDTPATPPGGEGFDLTVGGVAGPGVGEADRRGQILWRAYVHPRLAWEAAGDLGRAQAWDEPGFRGVAYAADNVLENLLNQCAEETYRTLPETTRRLALALLRQMVTAKSSSGQIGAAEDLIRVG